ncbi:MAG: hypothetical protein JWP18_137 [Solirubrobacterales bacterium]|nr:hypothetical protein [Solirubrobacterales bacterium]
MYWRSMSLRTSASHRSTIGPSSSRCVATRTFFWRQSAVTGWLGMSAAASEPNFSTER